MNETAKIISFAAYSNRRPEAERATRAIRSPRTAATVIRLDSVMAARK